jgi:Flagellar hook-length control protein FliK
MEPSGPASGIPPLLMRWQQAAPAPLQVGQLLQATVLENQAGKILLALNHRQLSAEASLPFKPGRVLTLEVRSLGEQPVLKVIAALQESATATAVRTLLPRYGPTTPLLASLVPLAQAPAGALPAAISEAARALLRQFPDSTVLSSAQGVKAAIEQSGSFLERHLVQADGSPSASPATDGDFKANLLRLLSRLEQLPGGDNRPPAAVPGRPAAAAPAAAAPATPSTPAAPVTRAEAPAEGPTPVMATRTPANEAPDAARSAATPQTVKRAVEAAGTALPQRAAAAPAGATPAAAGVPSGNPPPTPAGLNPPPPFAGVVPTPQTPVKASLDLLNSLDQLRLDLLHQTEAALARIHLNQLASLPKEGDHRLVEWLFDIPVRHGEDIDLWSARLYRDAEGNAGSAEQALPLWSVQLAFDLPRLGPVQAQINLQGERVSTHFRAARPSTLPLLHAHLHELRRSMQDAGLEVGAIDCRCGTIDDTDRPSPEPLINDQA